MKVFIAILVLIGVVAGGAFYYAKHVTATSVTTYRTATVQRGDLVNTISATGTLEAEDIVDIGAQVAGLVVAFGKDVDGKQIDYNSVVEKDAVLAYIDQTSYQAALKQTEATLAKSKADLEQLEAKAELTEQELKRAKNLRPSNAISETDYDTAVSNAKQAKANVDVGKATIMANEAALDVAKVNLGYTIIKSPVRGTVIDRRVNIGQTVVASLSAPSLFLIAKDLTRMEVWASVNEADIGRIKVGMPVQFTVDAHPGEPFIGSVKQVRMNATMTSNVVTYMVIVAADNPDGKLLPYLTAAVSFEVEHHSNVLMVPNAALRWQPSADQLAKNPGFQNVIAEQQAAGESHGVLWTVLDDGSLRPIPVTVGARNDLSTEISGNGIQEGLKVVIGEDSSNSALSVSSSSESGQSEAKPAADSDTSTTNPFLPKPPKGHRPPPGPPG
jgi:HlyD family secretion protein